MATKKTTKKSAPKKTVKKASVKAVSTVKANSVNASIDSKLNIGNSFKVKKSYIILILIMLVLGIVLYYARGLFVAAVVNGQPISRMAIVKEAEKQAGKQALDGIVRNALIEQEARKQKVTVTEKEIDDEISNIEKSLTKQGQKIDDALALQNMTRQDLRKLIRLDKLVGKIVGKDIKISDKEVSEYIEKNKDLLPKDQTEEQLKTMVSGQLKQQKLNEKVQAWLTDLKTKAKISYFVQY